MKRFVTVGISVSLFLVCACSSKEKVDVSTAQPEKFDKALNSTTGDTNEKVGVKNDTVRVQKIVYLEEQLAKTQGEITDLENAIYGQSKTYPGGMYLSLKQCRSKLSDKRLGGNGVSEPMEKWQKISQKDPDYNYRVDHNNNVVAVAEEDLSTRIGNLRKLQGMLNDSYDAFREKVDNCNERYKTALIDHGMNPADAEAQGEWVDGPSGYKVWKMRRPASVDPEELMKRKAQREKAESN